MAKRKRTNNGLQNITHQTKDRGTRIPLKIGSEFAVPLSYNSKVNFIISFKLP